MSSVRDVHVLYTQRACAVHATCTRCILARCAQCVSVIFAQPISICFVHNVFMELFYVRSKS